MNEMDVNCKILIFLYAGRGFRMTTVDDVLNCSKFEHVTKIIGWLYELQAACLFSIFYG